MELAMLPNHLRTDDPDAACQDCGRRQEFDDRDRGLIYESLDRSARRCLECWEARAGERHQGFTTQCLGWIVAVHADRERRRRNGGA
jgi:hypothetical protein